MQERRDRVESDLRKENDALIVRWFEFFRQIPFVNIAILIVRLENLKQGHKAESEMYR
mgnify:CR=1 FL=1